MAGTKATARSPALRLSVPASDLDLFLSALGALTWMLEWGPKVDARMGSRMHHFRCYFLSLLFSRNCKPWAPKVGICQLCITLAAICL